MCRGSGGRARGAASAESAARRSPPVARVPLGGPAAVALGVDARRPRRGISAISQFGELAGLAARAGSAAWASWLCKAGSRARCCALALYAARPPTLRHERRPSLRCGVRHALMVPPFARRRRTRGASGKRKQLVAGEGERAGGRANSAVALAGASRTAKKATEKELWVSSGSRRASTVA